MISTKQVVLITGASKGIGAALAKILATRHPGINLVLVARDRQLLEELATECRQRNADVLVVPTNLTQTKQIQSLVNKAIEYYARIDVLVNNAGYGQMGPIELIPPTAAREQFAVNFHAPLVLSQAVIPIMRQQGGGKIINVSSLGGRIPFPSAGMYSCSKFALEALSDVMRMELKAFNIQVSVVEPGPVITDFFRVASNKIQETISDYDRTPYAPVFKNLEAIDSRVGLLGWSADKTANAIARVIESRRPRPRYVLATGGNILIFMMNKMFPTWVRDEFWKRFYGIHKIEWNLSEVKGKRDL